VSASNLANLEEIQERLVLEELNGVISESGVDERLRKLVLIDCIEFL